MRKSAKADAADATDSSKEKAEGLRSKVSGRLLIHVGKIDYPMSIVISLGYRQSSDDIVKP
jgi:hypothetical protein